MKRNLTVKAFGRLVLAFIWCAISSGCWAEELDKGEAKAERVSSAGEKSSGSDVDNLTVTTLIDPETKEEFQEVKGEFIVEKFNFYPKNSNEKVIGINNVAIRHPSVKKTFPMGEFTWPSDIEYRDWDKLIGKKANIFCRIENRPFISNETFCRHSCSQKGSFKFEFDTFCTLVGNDDYFVTVE